MKLLEDFRNKELVKKLAKLIHIESQNTKSDHPHIYKLMHVCGTHERSVNQFGLRSLLPKNVEIISGPGCPVCICPESDILIAKELSKIPNTIITSFGDMLNVPTSHGSLLDEKANGADVRIVYSVDEAIKIAKKEHDKEIIFLAIGFETTTAPTAAALFNHEAPKNFSIVPSMRLVTPALDALISSGEISCEGLILPGHVSVVTGVNYYREVQKKFNIPCAIAGFEPVDFLGGILNLIEQINSKNHYIYNNYKRIVTEEGNTVSQKITYTVFEPYNASWRGFSDIPASGLKLCKEYENYSAIKKFNLENTYNNLIKSENLKNFHNGCSCGDVMKANIKASDCQLFGTVCTPSTPQGPCMVSDEGTCKINLEHGEF